MSYVVRSEYTCAGRPTRFFLVIRDMSLLVGLLRFFRVGLTQDSDAKVMAERDRVEGVAIPSDSQRVNRSYFSQHEAVRFGEFAK